MSVQPRPLLEDEEDTEPVLPGRIERDRRLARRRDIMVPARIQTRVKERFGMTRNVSRTGALLATPNRFPIGARALLKFEERPGAPAKEIEARIVRLEVNLGDQVGVWRYLMAVHFAEPLPDSISFDEDPTR